MNILSQSDLNDKININEYKNKEQESAEILLQNHNNLNYIGNIYVGSNNKQPAQQQRCVFDTGSTNTWVSSTLQEYQGAISGDH